MSTFLFSDPLIVGGTHTITAVHNDTQDVRVYRLGACYHQEKDLPKDHHRVVHGPQKKGKGGKVKRW